MYQQIQNTSKYYRKPRSCCTPESVVEYYYFGGWESTAINVYYLDGERPFDAEREREERDLDLDLDAERALGDLLHITISYN